MQTSSHVNSPVIVSWTTEHLCSIGSNACMKAKKITPKERDAPRGPSDTAQRKRTEPIWFLHHAWTGGRFIFLKRTTLVYLTFIYRLHSNDGTLATQFQSCSRAGYTELAGMELLSNPI